MAWHESSMTAAAGALLAVLDAKLPLNDKWSIYDTPATNKRVYRNLDSGANSEFYVYVDDTNAAYAIIELWEGWDTGTHTGTGASLRLYSTYTLRINKTTAGWGLAVSDHRFVFVEFGDARGYYVGQLKRFNTTKNMPVVICELEGVSKYNPLGYFSIISNTYGGCLFDENGTVQQVSAFAKAATDKHCKTIAGTFIVFETLVYNASSTLLMGQLEGVASWYTNAFLARNDIITLSGVDWVAIDGAAATKYWAFVRKA